MRTEATGLHARPKTLEKGAQMRRVYRLLVSAGLMWFVTATPAAADPVSITSGFVLITGRVTTGPISIAGTRGFSIEGLVDSGEGRVDPFSCFPCLPGEAISITSVFSGPAVIGTATLDGNPYEFTGSVNDLVGVSLQFDGKALKTPELGGSTTTLTAPFTMKESAFFRPDDVVPLNGFGIVTLTLTPSRGVTGWDVTRVRYDFANPVPEPATLTLFGLGLPAAALRARMRRRADKG